MNATQQFTQLDFAYGLLAGIALTLIAAALVFWLLRRRVQPPAVPRTPVLLNNPHYVTLPQLKVPTSCAGCSLQECVMRNQCTQLPAFSQGSPR